MHIVGDAFLRSPFRVEWAGTEWTRQERDEVERAVAREAASILRSARFVALLHDHQDVEAEVKVWLDGGTVPLHVSVWWEEAHTRFWFAVVDAVARERVALVVFRDLPCTTLDDMRADDAAFLEAIRTLVPRDGREVALDDVVDRLRGASGGA